MKQPQEYGNYQEVGNLRVELKAIPGKQIVRTWSELK
jgi:hypothetical protein